MEHKNITTDEAMFRMRLKSFVPAILFYTGVIAVAAGMVATLELNTSKLDQTDEQVEYNNERTDRKVKNAKEDVIKDVKIILLEDKIERLEEQLKDCKNGV